MIATFASTSSRSVPQRRIVGQTARPGPLSFQGSYIDGPIVTGWPRTSNSVPEGSVKGHSFSRLGVTNQACRNYRIEMRQFLEIAGGVKEQKRGVQTGGNIGVDPYFLVIRKWAGVREIDPAVGTQNLNADRQRRGEQLERRWARCASHGLPGRGE